MSGWSDNGTWTGEELRREVFYFASGGTRLYGSLFAAAKPSCTLGVVACASWGTEADRTDPLLHRTVLAAAKLGGAGLLFHYPGYGDSYGDLAELDLADLSTAACDAVAEASRRRPDVEWMLAGFMLGAAVACLARQRAAVAALLLVQPALSPGAYFGRLATTRRPLAPGPAPKAMMEVGVAPGMAYGYPVPQRILARAEQEDAAVAAALREFDGELAVVCHSAPAGPRLPDRAERIEVDGTWRFGSQNHSNLGRAAVGWLERRAGVGGDG